MMSMKPLTLLILVVFKKTVLFRILLVNFCQKKSLAITSLGKTSQRNSTTYFKINHKSS